MMTVFKHETVFDTAGRTMTFIVHKRLEIVVNLKEYEIGLELEFLALF